MINNIIQDKLDSYKCKTREDEINSLKEISQEIILFALAESNFFEKAAFHGGTALRILYNLPRFSEDLDFLLKESDQSFKWKIFLDKVMETCHSFGLELELKDKSELKKTNIPKIFLKQDSLGKLLNLNFKHNPKEKLSIKLEIDINPPAYSEFELKYIDFPTDYAIIAQNLPSSFASKLHALLCRPFIKGRDWYDFLWYTKKNIMPNLKHLQAALFQIGPWQNQKLNIDNKWLKIQLEEKIKQLDWNKVKDDVKPFLNEFDRNSLKLWSAEFFLNKLTKH